MRILGPEWDYIATDETAGKSGNMERMVYVYDKRKVTFQRIAGEIVLPQSKLIDDGLQFARTPFLVAFQSGWFRFMICTVHIYYGRASGPKLERRIEEIKQLVSVLSKRADDESANYIILGDFNIVSPSHRTMQALEQHGFEVAEGLAKLPTNAKQNKHYDQIAFKPRPGQLQYGDHAGVFNPFKTLFRENDFSHYLKKMKNKNALELDANGNALPSFDNRDYYLDKWRTFQISDHLPMWIELKIDFAEQFLHQVASPSFSVQKEHPLSFSMPELESD